MARLVLSLDGQTLAEYNMSKERYTVGRLPDNDIRIDNAAVSGHHALIINILNDSFLEDLNSTNGTYVNGQAIKKHFLQNNDVIELGKYKLKYINETPSQTTAADFEKTMVLRPDLMKKTAEQSAAKAVSVSDTQVGMKAIDTQAGMKPAQSAATAAPAPSPPQAMPTGAIQVLTGANAGKELELTKNLTTLGKPGVQVAVITRRPHGYFITHVEGANFPVVNGATLDAHPRELKDHDVIELAGVKMEFFLKS